jgi:tetratricopeptide (TPR) repeat protein/DNA-binding SARP family transcriptional activator
VDFRICGRVRVRLDGAWPVEWQSSKKTRGMLGVLLTRPGKTVPVHEVIEWLWGLDADPLRHAKILQTYVSRLRKVVERMDIPTPVKFVNSGYRLDVDPLRVDIHRANELRTRAYRAARDGDHDRASDLFSEVLDLVSEPPLIDLETSRAVGFRRSTQQNIVLSSHNALMISQLHLGCPELVLESLDGLQPDHELNVTLAKRRIDALRAASRHDEADEYHLRTRRNFKDHGLHDEADDLLTYFNRARQAIPNPRMQRDDLPGDKPAPRRLPPGHEELTGRDDLLSKLDMHSDHGRAAKVVVLSGTAGIGKTTLAVHWAHRVRKHFPGGDVYVDLQGFSQNPPLASSELVRRLLHVFHASPDLLGDQEAQLAHLASILGERRVLLLLDNVRDHERIAPVLDVAQNALILVTSRHHLDGLSLRYGAREVQVPTISRTATRRWLRDNVGTRCDHEPEAFAKLVELCAGIPLVLGIVSHYAKDRPRTTLAEIAEILHEEHRLLGMGASPDDADTSIRASFALSYRALSPEPQRLFRLLGLHPISTVSVGAATALAGTTREAVLTSLDSLVHANLIDQRPGHVQLHDLLHEFAAEQAEVDETDEARAEAFTRLLDWHLHSANNVEKVLFPYRPAVPVPPHDGRVQPMLFTGDQDAFQWFAAERHALVAIVRAAYYQGELDHVWRLANTINEPLKRHGHHREALTCLELALPSARATGEEVGEAGTLNNIGYIYIAMREFGSAYEYFSAAYERFREVGNDSGTAVSLHNLAYQRFKSNDLDGAERWYSEALAFERERGLNQARAGTLRRLGVLRAAQGNSSEANVLCHEALSLFEQTGNVQGVGQSLSDISQLHLDRGDVWTAIDFGERALAYHVRSQDRAALAETCCILAEAYHRRGNQLNATEYSREAVRIGARVGAVETQARALDVLATVLEQAGHRDAASEGWTQSFHLYRDIGNQAWLAVRERLKRLST